MNLASPEVRDGLGKPGYGRWGLVLSQFECEELRSLYDRPDVFRSRVDMARYRFGRGEYQYFAYPLPDRVAELREALYPQLAECANEWMAALSLPGTHPAGLPNFLAPANTNR